MMKIRGVFFDLDNTLVLASSLHRNAFLQAVEEISGVKINYQTHDTILDGLPTRKKLQMVKQIPANLHNSISKYKQELTFDLINATIKLDHAKIDLLGKLENDGYKIACVTNAVRKSAELLLQKIGVWSYIRLLISNEDVKNPKPNPEGYLKAMQYFNLSSDECLVVEDNPNGIKAGLESGALVWKVQGPQEVTWTNIQKYLS